MNTVELTWEDVLARIEYVKRNIKLQIQKIYGVPKME